MNYYFHSGTACLVMLALASTVAYAAETEHDLVDQSDIAKKTTPTELSVAPLDQIERPADRPSWLDNADVLDGPENIFVIVVGPCDSLQQCEEELQIMQQGQVSEFIKQHTKSDRVGFYPVNKEWIDERLVTKSYSGTVKQGDVRMFEQAVELTFSPEIKSEISAAWENEVVKDRLGMMGFLTFTGSTLLICLSMFLCMLSRRAYRSEMAAVAPIGPATVAFAGMPNVAETQAMGQAQVPAQVQAAGHVSSPATAQSFDDDASSSSILTAPIVCTAIYLLTTPGGYFWPKWVWFGCILMPFYTSWTEKSSQSNK